MARPVDFSAQIYQPLPELDRADAIVQRIIRAVSLGLIRQGDQLPSELELADMFGVAVATLRDALAALRDLKVVETRRGRFGGTFVVGAPSPSLDLLRKRLTALSMAELRDIGDEHASIAAATVRLAADRADPADLDRLESLAGALRNADSPGARTRADSRFHIGLAVAAQSERLMTSEIRLQGEVGELLWAPLTREFDQHRAAEDHLSIVAALRRDDREQAQNIALEHIRANVYHLIDVKLTLTYAGHGRDKI
ncbi:FadR/GntR family transcriptional regulator [Arthrobacter bambusae]|uniref:FadR/GntR family transcriptional regulator n=1 Tax=Arthrobacter bambusae TaxID=1338426 RepID=UPI00277DEE9A|nr:FCD domain-containing protein [Arthrobacter bambusae]MDQ0029912.1 DNA-binding FadR family transcriptional regulator [Arthrobacter bambusae]MDQ0097570.1 DNA-binding FadR family transcriptional regulator [Arthrobacter bambusae]